MMGGLLIKLLTILILEAYDKFRDIKLDGPSKLRLSDKMGLCLAIYPKEHVTHYAIVIEPGHYNVEHGHLMLVRLDVYKKPTDIGCNINELGVHASFRSRFLIDFPAIDRIDEREFLMDLCQEFDSIFRRLIYSSVEQFEKMGF